MSYTSLSPTYCSNCGRYTYNAERYCLHCKADFFKDKSLIHKVCAGILIGCGAGACIGYLPEHSPALALLGAVACGGGGAVFAMSLPFPAPKNPMRAINSTDTGYDSPAATKTCPFCAETIQEAAIVCRYCHRNLPILLKE